MIIFVVLEIKFTVSVTYYIIKIRCYFTAYDIKFATAHGKTQKCKRGKKMCCYRNWPLDILQQPV
jgi:hypothetical protein